MSESPNPATPQQVAPLLAFAAELLKAGRPADAIEYALYRANERLGIVEEIFSPSGGEHYRHMLELLSTIPWVET